MPGGDMRARDVDREEAIDFIEAAFSDGQLTREEYDARTGKALTARTVTDLDRLVRDLQRPGQTRVAARMTRLAEVTGRPAPTRNQITIANALTNSAKRFLVGVGVLVLSALVVFWFLPWLLFRDTMGVADEPDAAPVDLLTADGFRTFVDAVEARTGDTVVFSASVGSEHYGGAMVPADATSDRYVQWTWRDAGFEEGESTGTDLDAMRFDLSRIDPAAIPGLVEQAGDLVEEPETFSLHIDPDEDDLKGQCYRISAGNRFSEYGDIVASCSGRVLEVDPPD